MNFEVISADISAARWNKAELAVSVIGDETYVNLYVDGVFAQTATFPGRYYKAFSSSFVDTSEHSQIGMERYGEEHDDIQNPF